MKKSTFALGAVAAFALIATASQAIAQFIPPNHYPIEERCGIYFESLRKGKMIERGVNRGEFEMLDGKGLWVHFTHGVYYGEVAVDGSVQVIQDLENAATGKVEHTILATWETKVGPDWTFEESIDTSLGSVNVKCGQALRDFKKEK